MVLAYHVIFAAYGFWLPNDPRGSWSDFVGSWELFRFGPATTVGARRSLAAAPHDRLLRAEAKAAMKYPPVRFTGLAARAIGRGFAEFTNKSGLTVWACSILPDHVHMVLARHRFPAEQVVTLLKGAATRRLMAENLHPLTTAAEPGRWPPQPWARGQWCVFLDNADDILRAIRYVENNPIKDHKPPQRWPFVKPFRDDALPVGSRLNEIPRPPV